MDAASTALTRPLEMHMALAVALQSMSCSALEGLTLRRTQAVVEYLHMLSASPVLSEELRTTCATLSAHWQSTYLA